MKRAIIRGSDGSACHGPLSHLFCESYIGVRIGEIVWTVRNTMVNIEAATFLTFVVLVK